MLTRSLTLEEAFDELMRLRRVASAAKAWAAARGGARSDEIAAEHALLAAVLAWAGAR